MNLTTVKSAAGLVLAAGVITGAALATGSDGSPPRDQAPPPATTTTRAAPSPPAGASSTAAPTRARPATSANPGPTVPGPATGTGTGGDTAGQARLRSAIANTPRYHAKPGKMAGDYRPGIYRLPEPHPFDNAQAAAQRDYRRCLQAANGNTGRWSATECDCVYGQVARGQTDQLGTYQECHEPRRNPSA